MSVLLVLLLVSQAKRIWPLDMLRLASSIWPAGAAVGARGPSPLPVQAATASGPAKRRGREARSRTAGPWGAASDASTSLAPWDPGVPDEVDCQRGVAPPTTAPTLDRALTLE